MEGNLFFHLGLFSKAMYFEGYRPSQKGTEKETKKQMKLLTDYRQKLKIDEP